MVPFESFGANRNSLIILPLHLAWQGVFTTFMLQAQLLQPLWLLQQCACYELNAAHASTTPPLSWRTHMEGICLQAL